MLNIVCVMISNIPFNQDDLINHKKKYFSCLVLIDTITNTMFILSFIIVEIEYIFPTDFIDYGRILIWALLYLLALIHEAKHIGALLRDRNIDLISTDDYDTSISILIQWKWLAFTWYEIQQHQEERDIAICFRYFNPIQYFPELIDRVLEILYRVW